jgi:predicted DNA-binding protein (MmcQ/YjbR family)
MKVGTKLFAILSSADPLRVSLKCDPTLTIVFRQTYAAITPAPYLSKTSWNSVLIDGSIPEEMILSMIDQSYDLVVKGLSKAEREKLIG